jgi:hypothetical protein
MTEHAPIASWDREPKYYHPRNDGSFGFIEDDAAPPTYDVAEAKPDMETGRRQFPAAYSDPDQYNIRRDYTEPAIEQAQQGEQS